MVLILCWTARPSADFRGFGANAFAVHAIAAVRGRAELLKRPLACRQFNPILLAHPHPISTRDSAIR